MIGCDKCDDWYHWSCVGIKREPRKDSNWYCKNCKFFMESEKNAENAAKNSKKMPAASATTAASVKSSKITTPPQQQPGGPSAGGPPGQLRSKKFPKTLSSTSNFEKTSQNNDDDEILEEKSSPIIDKNQLHKCETCDSIFALKSSLMDHCQAKNHQAAIPYEESSKTGTGTAAINRLPAQQKKKLTKKCNCALCDFKCYNVVILKQHYLSAHSDDLTGLENVFKHIKCPMCDEKFCTKNGLFYHYKTEHSAILAKTNKEKKEIQKAEMWIKKEKFAENES